MTLIDRFRDRIRQLEEIPVGPAAWTAGFLSIVAIRHLLELHSGRFPLYPPSAFYVHYVLAYLAPLLLLSLILALFSSVSLERVLRLMLLAWGLTLLPPLVDTLVAGPHDAKIGYMELGETPWLTVFVHFFDPAYPLKGTTPGIRIEALLACVLALTYVLLRSPRRRVARAIGASFCVYAASLFVFTLPFLFARSVRLFYPGISASFLYNTAGRVPRPVSLEVRGDQTVLIYLVPLTLVLAAAALALAKPALLRRLLLDIMGSEGWGWGILAALGVYAGWRILEGVPKETPTAPFDALAFVAGPLSLLLAGGARARLAPDRSERLWRARSPVSPPSAGAGVLSAPGSPPSLVVAELEGVDRVDGTLEHGAAGVLLIAALVLAASASGEFAAFTAITVGAGVVARGIPRVVPWAVLAPQISSGIAAIAAFLAGYSLLAGDEAVTLLPSALYLLVFLAGFVTDLPRALPPAPGLLARLSRAVPASVPLIVLMVTAAELKPALSTGVILIAVLFSFASLAASQFLPARLTAASSLLGGTVVLGLLLSDPGHAASWRARALASPTYFLRLADHNEAAGDIDAAAGALNEALRREPALAAAHQHLGLIRYKGGDFAGAVEALREAVRLDPRDAELQGNLAVALLKSGHEEEALASVERGLTIDPHLPKLLFIRGQCLDGLGRTVEANRAWEIYIERAQNLRDEEAFVAAARQRLAGSPLR